MLPRFLLLSHLLMSTVGGQSSQRCVHDGNSFPWLANLLLCHYEQPRFPHPTELEQGQWQIDESKAAEINEELNDNRVNHLSTYKNSAEKMESVGYHPEVHKVTTEDGYILTYYRIRGKSGPPNSTEHRPPVLIQHGLFGHSGYWLTQKETNNLPYILAEEGFDVWLGNARGTMVSSHQKLSEDNDEYWDFSWEEMGYYDIPAAIDYILEKNGDKKLYYIGHSMGTTMFFVGMSLRPEYNEKIRLMSAYAPIAYVFHTTSAARIFAPLGYLPIVSKRKHCILPSDAIDALKPMMNRFCDPILMSSKICSNILFLMAGFDYQQTNMTQLEYFLMDGSNPTSLKTLQHYTQGLIWNDFRQFNRGKVANCEAYGTCSPPSYNLSAVTSPVALFYGPNDILADMRDVSRLFTLLPNVVLNYSVPFDQWNHIDFLTGISVRELVYDPTIDLMRQF